MSEHVESYAEVLYDDLRWEPNAPEAALVADDRARAALALRAHPDDVEQACVVLRWDMVSFASMGAPNDEAFHQHRLYEAGLKSIRWIGVVRESALVPVVQPMLSRATFAFRPLHFIIPTKECVVEVLAENVEVLRIQGRPRGRRSCQFPRLSRPASQ